jgi:hypothetical protein
MNVIESKSFERDAGGKPGSPFPHPALRLQALRRMEIFPWSMVAAAPTDALGAIGFAAPPSVRRRRKLAGVKQRVIAKGERRPAAASSAGRSLAAPVSTTIPLCRWLERDAEKGKPVSARIPLETLGLDHVHDFGWIQSKIIVI